MRTRDLSRQAQKCGLPSIPVDRNDVVAVYRVVHEAVDRARRGGGPTLIESKPWTLDIHSQDPIARMQQYLQWKGLWSSEWNLRVNQEIRREIDLAASPGDNA